MWRLLAFRWWVIHVFSQWPSVANYLFTMAASCLLNTLLSRRNLITFAIRQSARITRFSYLRNSSTYSWKRTDVWNLHLECGISKLITYFVILQLQHFIIYGNKLEGSDDVFQLSDRQKKQTRNTLQRLRTCWASEKFKTITLKTSCWKICSVKNERAKTSKAGKQILSSQRFMDEGKNRHLYTVQCTTCTANHQTT